MTKTGKQKRSLRNMYLTRQWHFPYMGMWVLVAICQLVLFNAVFYMLLEARWKEMQRLAGPLTEVGTMAERIPFLLGTMLGTVLFAAAAVFMAKVTAHRIAGPYIRFRNVFREVRDGNLDLKLRFRDYDRLDDVADAFNEMMDTIRAKVGKSVPG